MKYDPYSFFNNCVRGSTPHSTIQSGLAVCEGYAGLFNAMAPAAGIESVVVLGHGKGKYPPSSADSSVLYNIKHLTNQILLTRLRLRRQIRPNSPTRRI